jgi:putative SOS response-associated peptidase YedK
MFRNAFKKRRCLMQATGYYEWTGEAGSKQPFFIYPPDHSVVMFAGLWDALRAGEKDEWVRTFSIITGEPGKVSGDVHDRPPVILPPSMWSDWLEGSPDDAAASLSAVQDADLAYYPVSKAVSSPKHQGDALVEPITL